MKWLGNRESTNVEDRRGSRGGKALVGGGIGTLLLAAVVFFMGGDPTQVLDMGAMMNQASQETSAPAENDKGSQFVRTTLASTEDVWNKEFQKLGGTYTEPILVLFTGQTVSECGGANSASGPFYCPADKKVYLDLSFFNDLSQRFGVKGEFANSYVIAHEIGHHVQDLLGITTKVHNMQRRASQSEANRMSVMLELQADFLSGYWARRAQNLQLTREDIESALIAANAIGDDQLQKQSQGYVVPDAFTHGTSQQRMEWFMKGYNAQSIDEGNTFEDPNL